jgi:acetyl esterase/lipase
MFATVLGGSCATADQQVGACPATASYGEHSRQALDIYRAAAPHAPIVVMFHGGAWRTGDKSEVEGLARSLADQGALVVAPNYRSALDGDLFPAQASDAAEAVGWAIRNAARCGASEDRVYLAGFSAGGHLAALLAVDASWRERAELSGERLRGVVAIGGVFKIESVEGGFPRAIVESVFGPHQGDWDNASPLDIVERNRAAARRQPFLLIYGEQEPALARRETERFGQLLRDRGANVTLYAAPGAGHDGVLAQVSLPGSTANELLIDWIDDHNR